MTLATISTVRFRAGARIPEGADAGKVVDKLTSIYQKHGSLTPELVYEEGKRKTSPLYSFFEHDADRALQILNLDRARRVVSDIIIDVERDDGKIVPARAFMHINMPSEVEDDSSESIRSYVPIARVMADDDLRSNQVQRAWREFHVWRARWAFLGELDPLFKAAERIAKSG